MSEKVHPEPDGLGEASKKGGREPRVSIVTHGDVEAGTKPIVRIRTGHSVQTHKKYEVCRNSLCFISYKWKLRQLVLAIIEWKWFDRFILFNIAVISLLSACYHWREPKYEGINLVIRIIEYVINGIFTMELLLKVTAWGFICHKGAYLRNPWNVLDFLVVIDFILTIVPFMPSGGLNFLRLFRALRPLRSLNAIPQMKVLVNTLMVSIPKLGNVTLMGAFLFGIFAIVGITLMDGVFYHRCRLTPNPVLNTVAGCWQWEYAEVDRLCGGRFTCPEGTYCGGHEEDPSEDLKPVFPGGRQGLPWCADSAPTKLFAETDFIHFDHMGGAVLIVFQCMTLEGWTDIMYMVQDGYNEIVSTLYFCCMIWVTSHFLLNVALAVVDEVRDNFDEEELEDDDDEPTAEDAGGEEEEEEPEEELWIDCLPVRFLHSIATSEIFLNIILMAIIGNVITMCLEKYPAQTSWKDFIEVAEITFLAIFCVEMVIMLGAVGPVKYAKNPVTAFDGIIVIISLVQQALGQSGPLTALRTLRLFRVLNKLQDRWHSLRVLLKAIVHTGVALNYWLVLFVLALCIGTLLAQSIFNRTFHFNDPDSFDAVLDQDAAWCPGVEQLPVGQRHWNYWQDCIPRAHFDTFLWAFVTIFQIMTGENWNTVMYAGMRATHWGMTLFFWFLIIFGQILFVSLFLSILTSKFQLVNKQIGKEQAILAAKEAKRRAASMAAGKTSIFVAFRRTMSRGSIHSAPDDGSLTSKVSSRSLRGTRSIRSVNEDDGSTKRVDVKPRSNSGEGMLPGQVDGQEATQVLPLSLPDEQEEASPGQDADLGLASEPCPQRGVASEPMPQRMPASEGPMDEAEEEGGGGKTKKNGCLSCCTDPNRTGWPHGYAWFVLSEKNPLRKAARWILTTQVYIRGEKIKVFDNFILLCILLSTVCMMLDFPLRDPNAMLTKVLRTADTVFAIIFVVEMAVKLVALGLVWGPDAYLKSGWNWLDGLVVIVSITGMVSDVSGGFLKTLRILRALRPLRVISRNENLKVVVQTIFASVPDLATLLVVSSLFLLIFALVCLSYLKGAFYQCPMEEPLPAMMRDIEGLRTPLCVLDTLPTAASPLSYDNDAVASQDGAWNLTSNAWEVGSCSAGRHAWARATVDTPICIGRCDPMESASHQPPAWLCPPRFTRTEELPPVGTCASSRPPTADEQVGIAFTNGMMRAMVMPCGGSTVANDAVDYTAGSAASCRAVFCPAGSVSGERQATCRSNCRKHDEFCTDACSEQDLAADGDAHLTPGCASCLHECQASCECEDFCEPLIKDAALCHEQGKTWSPMLSQSFDNIWTSLLTLFEISTTEGWVDVMYAATDSAGIYVQPKRDTLQWLWAPFFVFYIFFMTMFLINLSVGIIVERFIALKNDKGRTMMTEAQERWVRSKLHLYKKKAFFQMTNLHRLPSLRRKTYNLVTHRFFDRAIMAAIMFNTLLMSLKMFPAPTDWYEPLLSSLNYCFFGIFLLEATLKIFALRINYFKDNWNVFDFVCVMSGVISLAVRIFSTVDIVAVSGVVRIFRIARLFRIMRSFKEVNKIFMAMILSLPKLGNVMAILLLVLTLYGILGVSLFSTAKKPPDGTLNVHGNFDDFWKAFITLFRASTGEAWNELMHDLSKDEKMYYRDGDWCSPADLFDPQLHYGVLESKCLTEEPNACVQNMFGQNIMPVIYWFSYIIVCLHLLMNLVIAVILDGYEEGRHTPQEEIDIELCMERWKKYDPDITEKLPLPKALLFVNEVCSEILRRQQHKEEHNGKAALSYTRRSCTADVDVGTVPMHFAKCFDMNVLADGQVSFSAATRQCLRIAVLAGNENGVGEIEAVDEVIDRRTLTKLRNLEQKKGQMEGIDLKLVIAATKLQRRYREHRAAREQQRGPARKGTVANVASAMQRGETMMVNHQAEDSPKDCAEARETTEREGSPPKAGTPESLLQPPRAG